MSEHNVARPHWGFWVIGIFTLVWNALGCINFLMQMSPDMVASMPATHRAIIEVRPWWGTFAFAVAVFGGFLGCLLLLLRKSAAVMFLVVSLVGVVVQVLPHADLIGSVITDPFELVMMIAMPFVVAIFLLVYARRVRDRGWIS